MEPPWPKTSIFTTALLGIFAVILATAVAEYLTPADFVVSTLYCFAIICCLWTNDRRILWAVAGICISLTFAAMSFSHPASNPTQHEISNRILTAVSIALLAVFVDRSILWHRRLRFKRAAIERQNEELRRANEELATREEEIARQNEELQSQTEELERQSEELRVANDDLAAREKTLEHLLALSRALAITHDRNDVMSAVCEALGLLMNGRAVAAGILEKQGSQIVVVCHHGFGPDGVAADRFPYDQSFASLVLNRNQSAYIEDISLRPDLKIPQPKNGEPMRSILATPLRVRGRPVGSLEVYTHEKSNWNEEHVALLESLAAQTSISLEVSELFSDVENERQRLEAVMQTAPVGIVISNLDGTDIRINAAGAAILGVPVDTNFANPKMANRFAVYRAGQPLPPEEYPMARARRSGEPVLNEELELVSPAGKRIAILASNTPIFDRNGKPVGVVGAFTDISTQKELQRELDRRRREAEEASVRKTRFLAAVSHDIRTPANAINLLAELIKRTAASPTMAQEVPSLAEELQGSANSLVNLVSDVLDLSRFDAGRIDLNETEFALAETIADELRQIQPLASAKSLQVKFDPPPEPIIVRTDRIKFVRVLANLVGNAIKFTSQGQIRVHIALASDRRIYVHVEDTGQGIESQYLPRIFDEFFQLRNPERDATKGAGLGLTICKRLVEAMGGDLVVQSTAGKGSTFTVILPSSAVVAIGSGLNPVEAPQISPASNGKPLTNVRILVVEDHDSTRASTRHLLSSEGADVMVAANGSDALRLAKEFDPQVMLLDLMLPDMSGAEVLMQLQSQRSGALRMILVLTGDTATTPTSEIKSLGADDVIHKPINVRALVDRIRAGVA